MSTLPLLITLSRRSAFRVSFRYFRKMPPTRKRKGINEKGSSDHKRSKANEEDGLQWSEFGDATAKGQRPLVFLTNEAKGCDKVAGFDLDGTIISTASGRQFPTGCNDWKFCNDQIPAKLRSLSDDGYKVVIITNQAGIEKGKTTIQEIKTKIANILHEIGIKIQIFISTGENHFRKPSTKMWEFMAKNCNENVTVDKGKSFYVGDAGGRAKEWMPGKPKDISCSDRKFAANLGIDFYTTEEFFEGQEKAAFEWRTVNPAEYVEMSSNSSYSDLLNEKRELIIMVGSPASGKSTICRKYLAPKNYVIVNRDTLKTQGKCLKYATEALESGKSVVVDNTNPSKETRAAYLKIAKALKVPSRCFWLQTPVDLAHHLNMIRQIASNGKERRVPDVGFNIFKSKFEEPTLNEGFVTIEKIEFKAEFEDDKKKELFLQWT